MFVMVVVVVGGKVVVLSFIKVLVGINKMREKKFHKKAKNGRRKNTYVYIHVSFV